MGIDLRNGYRDLKQHIGHELHMSGYGDEDDWENVAIECLTCMEILLDFDRPDEVELTGREWEESQADQDFTQRPDFIVPDWD